MTTTMNIPSSEQERKLLRSERIAGGILPKVLNSFDMIAIFLCIVLWIGNSAIIAGAGAAGYVYWLLGFITFLIPGAIVTGQLGLMFPGEGSIYVWTTKAFGDFMGFLGGFCAWWPGILAMMTAGAAIVTLIQQLGLLFGITVLSSAGEQGLVIIAVLVFSYILSILRFRVTQNLVNAFFLLYGGTILLVGLAGVFWLLAGHAANTDLSWKSGQWLPSRDNIAFYAVAVLALLGVEVPLNMGVEIKETRSITRYLLWGSLIVMLAYLIVTFGIMIAVPAHEQGSMASIVKAIQNGFGPLGLPGAVIVDLILIGYFLFVTTVFNYSFARLIFVSGLDRRLPAIMSKVSANKVPWVAPLMQAIVGLVFTAIIFILSPLLSRSSRIAVDDLATLMYDILEGSTAVIWCVSMVILFVVVIALRHKYRERFVQVQFVPNWLFYLCAAVGSLASCFGIYLTFTSAWTTTVNTVTWDIWILGITLVSLLIAVVGFFIGQRTKKSEQSDEELITEVTS